MQRSDAIFLDHLDTPFVDVHFAVCKAQLIALALIAASSRIDQPGRDAAARRRRRRLDRGLATYLCIGTPGG